MKPNAAHLIRKFTKLCSFWMLNVVVTSACVPLNTVTRFVASHLLSLRYSLVLSSHLHPRNWSCILSKYFYDSSVPYMLLAPFFWGSLTSSNIWCSVPVFKRCQSVPYASILLLNFLPLIHIHSTLCFQTSQSRLNETTKYKKEHHQTQRNNGWYSGSISDRLRFFLFYRGPVM
jgi:hypothetical protein